MQCWLLILQISRQSWMSLERKILALYFHPECFLLLLFIIWSGTKTHCSLLFNMFTRSYFLSFPATLLAYKMTSAVTKRKAWDINTGRCPQTSFHCASRCSCALSCLMNRSARLPRAFASAPIRVSKNGEISSNPSGFWVDKEPAVFHRTVRQIFSSFKKLAWASFLTQSCL